MLNSLNRLDNVSKTRIPGPRSIVRSAYQPSTPRATLGVACVALTVVTIATSVILPAQMDSRSRESRVLAASKAAPPAPRDLVTLASITVVAAREPGPAAIPVSSAVQ